jgi:hypothetical protein
LSNSPENLLETTVDLGFEVRDLLGMRLNVLTPVDGLLFGVSAYGGDQEVETTGSSPAVTTDPSTDLLGAHVELIGDKLWLRAELATNDFGGIDSDGYYVEAAYKLTRHWQVAARLDWWDASLGGIDPSLLPPFFDEILHHEDVAVGLNYWFSPDFVLRLDYHQVSGNRFAFPGDPERILQAVTSGQFEEDTSLVLFGAQFSF